MHMYMQGCLQLQCPETQGEEKEGHLHHPEIISKFTEQAFYPIGSSGCVMSHGHSVDTGFR